MRVAKYANSGYVCARTLACAFERMYLVLRSHESVCVLTRGCVCFEGVCSLQLYVCVCVCVRARACVCVQGPRSNF